MVLKLSDALLIRIISKLPFADLIKFQMTCKYHKGLGFKTQGLINLDMCIPNIVKWLLRYTSTTFISLAPLPHPKNISFTTLYFKYYPRLVSLELDFATSSVFLSWMSASLTRSGYSDDIATKFLPYLRHLTLVIQSNQGPDGSRPLLAIPALILARLRTLTYNNPDDMLFAGQLSQLTSLVSLTYWAPSDPNYVFMNLPVLETIKTVVLYKSQMESYEILGLLHSFPNLESLTIYTTSIQPPSNNFFSAESIIYDREERSNSGTLAFMNNDGFVESSRSSFKNKYRLDPLRDKLPLKTLIVNSPTKVPLDIFRLVIACGKELTTIQFNCPLFASSYCICEKPGVSARLLGIKPPLDDGVMSENSSSSDNGDYYDITSKIIQRQNSGISTGRIEPSTEEAHTQLKQNPFQSSTVIMKQMSTRSIHIANRAPQPDSAVALSTEGASPINQEVSNAAVIRGSDRPRISASAHTDESPSSGVEAAIANCSGSSAVEPGSLMTAHSAAPSTLSMAQTGDSPAASVSEPAHIILSSCQARSVAPATTHLPPRFEKSVISTAGSSHLPMGLNSLVSRPSLDLDFYNIRAAKTITTTMAAVSSQCYLTGENLVLSTRDEHPGELRYSKSDLELITKGMMNPTKSQHTISLVSGYHTVSFLGSGRRKPTKSMHASKSSRGIETSGVSAFRNISQIKKRKMLAKKQPSLTVSTDDVYDYSDEELSAHRYIGKGGHHRTLSSAFKNSVTTRTDDNSESSYSTDKESTGQRSPSDSVDNAILSSTDSDESSESSFLDGQSKNTSEARTKSHSSDHFLPHSARQDAELTPERHLSTKSVGSNGVVFNHLSRLRTRSRSNSNLAAYYNYDPAAVSDISELTKPKDSLATIFEGAGRSKLSANSEIDKQRIQATECAINQVSGISAGVSLCILDTPDHKDLISGESDCPQSDALTSNRGARMNAQCEKSSSTSLLFNIPSKQEDNQASQSQDISKVPSYLLELKNQPMAGSSTTLQQSIPEHQSARSSVSSSAAKPTMSSSTKVHDRMVFRRNSISIESYNIDTATRIPAYLAFDNQSKIRPFVGGASNLSAPKSTTQSLTHRGIFNYLRDFRNNKDTVAKSLPVTDTSVLSTHASDNSVVTYDATTYGSVSARPSDTEYATPVSTAQGEIFTDVSVLPINTENYSNAKTSQDLSLTDRHSEQSDASTRRIGSNLNMLEAYRTSDGQASDTISLPNANAGEAHEVLDIHPKRDITSNIESIETQLPLSALTSMNPAEPPSRLSESHVTITHEPGSGTPLLLTPDYSARKILRQPSSSITDLDINSTDSLEDNLPHHTSDIANIPESLIHTPKPPLSNVFTKILLSTPDRNNASVTPAAGMLNKDQSPWPTQSVSNVCMPGGNSSLDQTPIESTAGALCVDNALATQELLNTQEADNSREAEPIPCLTPVVSSPMPTIPDLPAMQKDEPEITRSHIRMPDLPLDFQNVGAHKTMTQGSALYEMFNAPVTTPQKRPAFSELFEAPPTPNAQKVSSPEHKPTITDIFGSAGKTSQHVMHGSPLGRAGVLRDPEEATPTKVHTMHYNNTHVYVCHEGPKSAAGKRSTLATSNTLSGACMAETRDVLMNPNEPYNALETYEYLGHQYLLAKYKLYKRCLARASSCPNFQSSFLVPRNKREVKQPLTIPQLFANHFKGHAEARKALVMGKFNRLQKLMAIKQATIGPADRTVDYGAMFHNAGLISLESVGLIDDLLQHKTLYRGPKQIKVNKYIPSNRYIYHLLHEGNADFANLHDAETQLNLTETFKTVEPLLNINLDGKPFYTTKTADSGFIENLYNTHPEILQKYSGVVTRRKSSLLNRGSFNTGSGYPSSSTDLLTSQTTSSRKISRKIGIADKSLDASLLRIGHEKYDLPFDNYDSKVHETTTFIDPTLDNKLIDKFLGNVIVLNSTKEEQDNDLDAEILVNLMRPNTKMVNILILAAIKPGIQVFRLPSASLAPYDLNAIASSLPRLRYLEVSSLPPPASCLIRNSFVMGIQFQDIYLLSVTTLRINRAIIVDMKQLMRCFPNLRHLFLRDVTFVNNISDDEAFSDDFWLYRTSNLETISIICLGFKNTSQVVDTRRIIRNVLLPFRNTLQNILIHGTRMPLHMLRGCTLHTFPRVKCVEMADMIFDDPSAKDMQLYIHGHLDVHRPCLASLFLIDALGLLLSFSQVVSVKLSSLMQNGDSLQEDLFFDTRQVLSSSVVMQLHAYLMTRNPAPQLKCLRHLFVHAGSEVDLAIFMSRLSKVADIQDLASVHLEKVFDSQFKGRYLFEDVLPKVKSTAEIREMLI